jgi:hypothetical protein
MSGPMPLQPCHGTPRHVERLAGGLLHDRLRARFIVPIVLEAPVIFAPLDLCANVRKSLCYGRSHA